MRKNRLIALIGTLTMAAAGLAAVSAGVSSKKADSVSATDYSNTIRVYVDLNWGSESNVQGQIGSGDTWGNFSLSSSSSDSSVDSSKGKYYKDGTSAANLTKINLCFQEGSVWWHPYDSSDDWNRDNSNVYGTFKPGYEYKITSIILLIKFYKLDSGDVIASIIPQSISSILLFENINFSLSVKVPTVKIAL